MTENTGVAIVSGGLDSVTMVHHLLDRGDRPRLLSFDYGQRHKKELRYVAELSLRTGLDWDIIELDTVTGLIANSALTLGAEVPEGHYAEDNMALTVVPNRNMMMLSVGIAVAVSEQLSFVAAGMHSGDHAQYPDCRPEFVSMVQETARIGNAGFIDPDFIIWAPFIDLTKNDIAQRAFELGVQPAETWSCYKGGPTHCGRCGTCVERLEAIASVCAPNWDQTVYQDNQFWKEAVSEYKSRA